LTGRNSNSKSITIIICVAIILKIKQDIDLTKSYIDVYGSLKITKKVTKLIEDIWKGFNNSLIPKLTDDGTSGAYRMRNEDKENVAIFKPIDEEPFAPNNPRGH